MIKKELLLDKIPLNPYFYKEINKQFKNKDLAIYLLVFRFLAKQKNPDGPYF